MCGVSGMVAQWDLGSLPVQCQASQGCGVGGGPGTLSCLVPGTSVRVLARLVCGGSTVGWSRQPDSKHGQTSRPFSRALGSQA